MYVVGLTGQIASGKTTLAGLLKDKGAIIISADSISHDLLRRPDVKEQIVEEFGSRVTTGEEIERRKLAAASFGSKEALEKLNRIMWPPIIDVIKEELQLLSRTLPANEIIVLDAPLLLEAGLDSYTDIIVVVNAAYEKQQKRLIAKGYSKVEAEARIKMREPKEELLEKSDYTIENNDDFELLEKEAEKLWHFVKKQHA